MLDQINQIITQAKTKSQSVEVFAVNNVQTPVIFHANKLKSVETKQSQGYALRVFHNGKVGFASSTKPGDVEHLVQNALDTSQYGVSVNYEFSRHKDFPAIEVFDPETEAIPVEQMISIGEELIERIRSSNSQLLCDCRIVKSTSDVYLENSEGGSSQYRKTVFAVSFEGTLMIGTDMLFVMDSIVSCHPVREVASIVTNVIEQLTRTKQTSKISNNKIPVVFTPQAVSSVLMNPLLSALNGRSVLRDISPFSSKLSYKIMDSRLSLQDDSTIPFIPASRPSDAEGIPSRQTVLIEDGVLKSFLYDLQTAAYMGTVSTASAARSINALPSPAPGVLRLLPGSKNHQRILDDVPEGILVEQVIGAGQSNVQGGDFSGNILLGYRFQHGEIIGRVKDTMISGNVHEILNQVLDVSEDGRWIGGSLWSPYIMLDGVSVASST